MQFLNSIFADNRLLTIAASIASFLLFAVLVLLIVRLLFGNRLKMSGGRARQQRLGVVDAYDMDRQRQLVLVRRDNTEHLILIGGPNDVLIESAIVRVEGRDARDRTGRDATSPSRLPVPDAWTPPTASPDTVPSAPSAPVLPTAPPAPPAVAPMPPPSAPPIRPTLAAASPAEDFSRPAPTTSQASALPDVLQPAATTDLAPPIAVEEETVPADVAPPEPPKAPPRADIFARLRGRGTPPASSRNESVIEPPAPPVPVIPPSPPPFSAPAAPVTTPAAEADFFESEIAKALAPSMRPKPVVPAPLDGAASPPKTEVAAPEPRPTPPRPAFRPFTMRREPTLGDETSTGRESATGGENAPVRPQRPPPPPFFARPLARPQERAEPSVKSEEPTPSPVGPPPDSDQTSQATREPEAAPIETPIAPRPEPTPPPLPEVVAEAGDPFEEEMARLLGRTPGKS